MAYEERVSLGCGSPRGRRGKMFPWSYRWYQAGSWKEIIRAQGWETQEGHFRQRAWHGQRQGGIQREMDIGMRHVRGDRVSEGPDSETQSSWPRQDEASLGWVLTTWVSLRATQVSGFLYPSPQCGILLLHSGHKKEYTLWGTMGCLSKRVLERTSRICADIRWFRGGLKEAGRALLCIRSRVILWLGILINLI